MNARNVTSHKLAAEKLERLHDTKTVLSSLKSAADHKTELGSTKSVTSQKLSAEKLQIYLEELFIEVQKHPDNIKLRKLLGEIKNLHSSKK